FASLLLGSRQWNDLFIMSRFGACMSVCLGCWRLRVNQLIRDFNSSRTLQLFAGGEDYGYFDNPRVAGSIPVMASSRVAQLVEHWNVPSSPHSPAGKTDSSRDKTALRNDN